MHMALSESYNDADNRPHGTESFFEQPILMQMVTKFPANDIAVKFSTLKTRAPYLIRCVKLDDILFV
jgi:hypothetical protein